MWLFGAIVALAVGFALGCHLIRRGRRPLALEGTTSLAWTEQPVPVWQQEPIQALFIGGHAASVLSLAVLFGLDLARGTPAVGAALGGHLALMAVWFMAGSLLAFPVAYRYAGRMPMFVFVNGVARGQYASDWGAFSHFRADATTRVIRLTAPGRRRLCALPGSRRRPSCSMGWSRCWRPAYLTRPRRSPSPGTDGARPSLGPWRA